MTKQEDRFREENNISSYEHNISDIYRDYVDNVDPEQDWGLFKELCYEYDKEMVNKVLEGKTVNLGYQMGRVYGARVKRGSTKRVDWKETDKHRTKDGEITQYYYFNDKWFPMIKWERSSPVKGIKIYKFVPAKGRRGESFQERFRELCNDLKKKFRFPIEDNIKLKN